MLDRSREKLQRPSVAQRQWRSSPLGSRCGAVPVATAIGGAAAVEDRSARIRRSVLGVATAIGGAAAVEGCAGHRGILPIVVATLIGRNGSGGVGSKQGGIPWLGCNGHRWRSGSGGCGMLRNRRALASRQRCSPHYRTTERLGRLDDDRRGLLTEPSTIASAAERTSHDLPHDNSAG